MKLTAVTITEPQSFDRMPLLLGDECDSIRDLDDLMDYLQSLPVTVLLDSLIHCAGSPHPFGWVLYRNEKGQGLIEWFSCDPLAANIFAPDDWAESSGWSEEFLRELEEDADRLRSLPSEF